MKRISGPLDLWPYPIINAIIVITTGDDNDSNESVSKTYEVNRDDDGKIESIQLVHGETDE